MIEHERQRIKELRAEIRSLYAQLADMRRTVEPIHAARAAARAEGRREGLRTLQDGIDALSHALYLLPADCNQRLGMEGALKRMEASAAAIRALKD